MLTARPPSGQVPRLRPVLIKPGGEGRQGRLPMQITIEDISPVEKRVEFEVPWTDVAPSWTRPTTTSAGTCASTGFRPGKAPAPVLEKLYRQPGRGRRRPRAGRDVAGPGHPREAARAGGAAPVDQLELKSGEPFKFSARVEVRSQVAPKDYSGVAARAPRGQGRATSRSSRGAGGLPASSSPSTSPVEGRDADRGRATSLLVEVHGRVGEHKVKKRTAAVDLRRRGPAGRCPAWPSRLRGVAIGAEHDRDRSTRIRRGHQAARAGRQGRQPARHHQGGAREEGPRPRRRAGQGHRRGRHAGGAERQGARAPAGRRQAAASSGELEARCVKELIKRNAFPIAPALVERHAEAHRRARPRAAGDDGPRRRGAGRPSA